MPDMVTILAATGCITSGGSPIATGFFAITPTDAYDQPIPVQAAAGAGGAPEQMLAQAAIVAIVAGGIVGLLKFPNPATSSPQNVKARIEITDTTTRKAVVTTYVGVNIVPDSAGNWNFADLETGLTTGSVPVTLIVGPPGPAANPRGIYDPTLVYAIGDLVSYEGSSYISRLNENADLTPDSNLTAWMLSSARGTSGSVTATPDVNITDGTTSYPLGIRTDLDPSLLYALLDQYQRKLLSVDSGGDTHIHGDLIVDGTLQAILTQTLVDLSNGLNINSQSAVAGILWLVQTINSQVALAVTTAGLTLINGGFSARLGGNITGGLAVDALTVAGKPVSTYAPQPMRGLIGLGQSNMEAWSAAPLLNLFPSRYNAMFAPDGINDKFQSTAKTGLIPLQERLYELDGGAAPGTMFECGETGLTAMADALSLTAAAEDGVPTHWLVSVAAQGGDTLSQMGSGSDVETRFINQVAAGAALGGPGYNVYAFPLRHGEAEPASTTYAADVTAFLAHKAALVMASTGQSNVPITFATQQSSTPSGGYGSGGTMVQPLALMAAARANPALIKVVGPLYDRQTMPGSGQHNGNAQNYRSGLRTARAMRVQTTGRDWLPLSFKAATRLSATVIRVDFNVPVGPLVIEPTTPGAPMAHSGLEYADDANSVPSATITAVSLFLPGGGYSYTGNCLYLTLSSDSSANSNPIIYAARTWPTGGSSEALGGTTGARTDIHDSDNRFAQFAPALWNYLCHDQIALS